MYEDDLEEVVEKLADLSIIQREEYDRSVSSKDSDIQFCVRLRDLVLDICQ